MFNILLILIGYSAQTAIKPLDQGQKLVHTSLAGTHHSNVSLAFGVDIQIPFIIGYEAYLNSIGDFIKR